MTKPNRRIVFKFIAATLVWGGFLVLFSPFYAEILLAGIFAFAMHPVLARLIGQRFPWRASIAIVLLLLIAVLAVPLSIVGYKAYAYVLETSRGGFQNTPLFEKLAQAKTDLVRLGQTGLEKVGLENSVDLAGLSDDGFSRVVNLSLWVVTSTVQHLPSLLLSLFVMCAALFFFLAEAGPLKHIFLRQGLLEPPVAERLVKLLQQSCYNTVISSVLISIMQATIVAVGAIFIISGDFTVIWVVTFFCSFVPVIGAGPVAGALGVYQLLVGKYGKAIGLVVTALVAGTTDNVVRPFLISSGDEDLHPIVSLLAIIGALVVFGMPGLFFGPVIASVAVKIIPTLTNQAEPEVTASGKDGREG